MLERQVPPLPSTSLKKLAANLPSSCMSFHLQKCSLGSTLLVIDVSENAIEIGKHSVDAPKFCINISSAKWYIHIQLLLKDSISANKMQGRMKKLAVGTQKHPAVCAISGALQCKKNEINSLDELTVLSNYTMTICLFPGKVNLVLCQDILRYT